MSGFQSELIVVGVTYNKVSLDIRSKFALTGNIVKAIYEWRSGQKPSDFFILSTCNRTEIYSVTTQPDLLREIFAQFSQASASEVAEYTFEKRGEKAINHLYRVAAGLDSQILGDYEIIGQLKNAFAMAKTHKVVSGYMEKLVNSALQASRQVRNRTSISDGTTSVSYAVIQQLKQKFTQSEVVKVCLLGMGKFGELTLKNLQHYLPQHEVIIVNRNEERAREVSEKYLVPFKRFEEADEAIEKADVLVVATGADHPIIAKSQIENSSVKLVFDLSMPSNVSADVKLLKDVLCFDIDSLSEIINETISRRTNQIPTALEIIEDHIGEFKKWEARRTLYAPVLN